MLGCGISLSHAIARVLRLIRILLSCQRDIIQSRGMTIPSEELRHTFRSREATLSGKFTLRHSIAVPGMNLAAAHGGR